MLLAPRPAPNRHSASAHALASFCKIGTAAKRSLGARRDGHVVPSREVRRRQNRSRRLSSGPPQLTPMACMDGGRSPAPPGAPRPPWSRCSTTRPPADCRRARWGKRCAVDDVECRALSCALPSTTAVLVPPMSTPTTTPLVPSHPRSVASRRAAGTRRRAPGCASLLHFCSPSRVFSTFPYEPAGARSTTPGLNSLLEKEISGNGTPGTDLL